MGMRWILGIAVVALVLTLVLAACGGAKEEITVPDAAEAALDGKALTEERCVTCHDLGRIEAANKTPDEWQANVERMVSKGAVLNEDEQKAVIDYLAETYK